MQPRFPLGKVIVRAEAGLAMKRAGLDADFFLDKHAAGDCGDANLAHNERGLREGSLVLSKFHTLRGHEILVITFPDKGETHLVCPPNSIIKRVPLPDLAAWGKPQGEDMKGQPGNGSSRFEIGQADMGGWVRINASGAALPDDLPTFLAHTLADWFRQRPQFRLVCVVPISRDGTTVELHGWYECHVFPATPSCPQPIK